MPVPGGSDSINGSAFSSAGDFRARVDQLQPGMGESQVFANLGRNREDMTRLGRDEIVRVLYGGSAMQLLDNASEREDTRAFLGSLYGYRMSFRNTKKEHGFSSPIRVKTQESGYDYTVNLIFQNGILFEKPILAGGMVNDSSSRTLFDYLNPGIIVDQVR